MCCEAINKKYYEWKYLILQEWGCADKDPTDQFATKYLCAHAVILQNLRL